MNPERTGLQIIGGPSGTAAITLRPPWQTEQADLVIVAITAWGAAGTHLIFGSVDGNLVLQGALTLTNPDHGFVFCLNGPGSFAPVPAPLRVSEFVTVLPDPAAGGQIFLHFFWQRIAVPTASDLHSTHLPTLKDVETVDDRRQRQDDAIWKRMRGLPPDKLLRQKPEELTKRQKEQLRRLEAMMNPPTGR